MNEKQGMSLTTKQRTRWGWSCDGWDLGAAERCWEHAAVGYRVRGWQVLELYFAMDRLPLAYSPALDAKCGTVWSSS